MPAFLQVDATEFVKTAREDYPIFSSAAATFDYSAHKLLDWKVNFLKRPWKLQ